MIRIVRAGKDDVLFRVIIVFVDYIFEAQEIRSRCSFVFKGSTIEVKVEAVCRGGIVECRDRICVELWIREWDIGLSAIFGIVDHRFEVDED